MKNAVQNETMSYALGFGEKSKFDEATLEIFKEFGAKSIDQLYKGKTPRSYLFMIQEYTKVVRDVDKKFVWCKAFTAEEFIENIKKND